jgi:cytochrome c7-like protein
MSQIFPRSSNTFSRASAVGGALLAVTALVLMMAFGRSSYSTQQDVEREQPVPFSHAHHVGGMGLDCRYCHTSVEVVAAAGIPPTKTCMNCHSQIWNTSPTLEPVRSSFRTDQSIQWTRVHDLPDFAYFNHSIHVNKGVGCEVCHGRVDKMPLMYQKSPLTMEWCLECHRHPEKFVRRREDVFKMGYEPPGGDQLALGRELVKEYKISSWTSCSTCHR